MAEQTINILQIGQENWSQSFSIPQNLNWIHYEQSDISDFLEQQNQLNDESQEKNKKEKVSYQALVLSDHSLGDDITLLSDLFSAYEVFYSELALTESEKAHQFLLQKMGQPFKDDTIEALIKQFEKGLFVGQYGAKLPVTDLQFSSQFLGTISMQGHAYADLKGNFGPDFQEIADFPFNVPYANDKFLDLFLETQIAETCRLKMVVSLIPNGSVGNVVKEWVFDQEALKNPLLIDADQSGVLHIQLLAKGFGQLKIGPLHYRWSRNGLGEFLLGGQRFADDNGQEFMTYFDPADFKPPLCVYFSDFRSAEGFEGYWMMKSLGTPFLLLCDPRLEGGSFYIGSESYEAAIVKKIQETLDFLGFTSDQLILSGLSMGTYGAIYHGTKLKPHSIIVGKPVLNMGSVAQSERVKRPGGFPTALDIQQVYYDSLDEKASKAFDDRIWNQFQLADFSHTKFIVAYMKDDDYDHTGFSDLLKHLEASPQNIVGRGWQGRHDDAASEVPAWFITQYRNLISHDFNRKFNE
ncbi:accessory Sec system protein Asp2 [Streptococcus urinalis FB127-CNA-2]|uniref:Accessory Sec system protein Asp2 n=1 Tax=Streptococcus urinalis 2285-97 TaxID=764291 RepID=G5KI10_9STRE|nr:accessory Sec system protein Asp2 [Streptococcus urinalis]EHJ57718.1 accessory Sec system protein Asp2 [Streptococcus urinalis 2285-97]EKS20497.1 accessory Sec system protein Asp2 [Streptococcus urinalis FB127-CNA-2]VEF31191.1 Accessory secretory protein Asp2 [Streptococcus urinalis]